MIVIGINWHKVDLSDDNTTRELGEEIFSVVEDNALIVGGWDTIGVLQYLQFIEGQRPDVTLINVFLIQVSDMETLMINSAQHRSVYSDRITDRIEQELIIEESVDSMHRLSPK